MTLTSESFGLTVTAPFMSKNDLIQSETIIAGNVTKAFRMWGDSSTGSSEGDHVHISDDRGDVLVLTTDQFEAIQRLDLRVEGDPRDDDYNAAIVATDGDYDMAVEAFTADESFATDVHDRLQAHEETVLKKAQEGGPLRLS